MDWIASALDSICSDISGCLVLQDTGKSSATRDLYDDAAEHDGQPAQPQQQAQSPLPPPPSSLQQQAAQQQQFMQQQMQQMASPFANGAMPGTLPELRSHLPWSMCHSCGCANRADKIRTSPTMH